MKRTWPWAVALVSLIAVFAGTQAATAQNAVPAKKSVKKKTAAPKKPSNKKYRASSGKPAPKATASKKPAGNGLLPMSAAMSMAPANAPKPAAPKTTTTTPARRRTIRYPRPVVSASTRREASEVIYTNVSRGADLPVENAAALVPFFEQLYRRQKGEMPGPMRILHYGDSHTAADDLTGDLRTRFQEKFGDGGSGFSFAGRPWTGYRRLDVRSGSTRGWHTEGLAGRSGDGIYGLGGVSMSTSAPKQGVFLQADCQQLELFYLQQPGGGALELYDNGAPVERIETAGELAPGYYRYAPIPGPHRFELETLDHAPVRLFGWVAENSTGVTYETLGINGARASMALGWDEAMLRSNIERRNPGLIVIAYGTNEAGQKDLSLAGHRETMLQLITRFRQASPTATILVIGPPDRFIRVRGKGWVPLANLDQVVEAQRQAAIASGAAFWDTRAKMGGKGSMRNWVYAGMAQGDYVHFTSPGYRMLGDAIFRDVISQYELFLKARDSIAVASPVAVEKVAAERH